MRITFDIDPIPASRPRVSRWSTYYPKRYTKFREKMKALTGELETTPFEKLVSVSLSLSPSLATSIASLTLSEIMSNLSNLSRLSPAIVVPMYC